MTEKTARKPILPEDFVNLAISPDRFVNLVEREVLKYQDSLYHAHEKVQTINGLLSETKRGTSHHPLGITTYEEITLDVPFEIKPHYWSSHLLVGIEYMTGAPKCFDQSYFLMGAIEDPNGVIVYEASKSDEFPEDVTIVVCSGLKQGNISEVHLSRRGKRYFSDSKDIVHMDAADGIERLLKVIFRKK